MNYRKKARIVGLIIFLITLLITQYSTFLEYKIIKAEESKAVLNELNSVSNRVKKTLSHSLSATNILAMIIENYGLPDNFDSIAHDILTSHNNIDALQLTRRGVITHTYPLQGNEEAMGFDILKDSIVSIEAYKAIDKGELYFAGPQKLVQGGMAVIGRLPIFIDGEFFGFSVVIVKLPTLVQSIRIDNSEARIYNYQLSKKNPHTNLEQFFLSDPIDPEHKASQSVEIPTGEWKLYVSPRNPSRAYGVALKLSLLGLLISFITGLYFFELTRQPDKLKKLVNAKTEELSKSKQYFRSIIENSADAIVLFDKFRKVTYQSPSAERISGYSLEETKSINGLSILHPDDRERESFDFKELVASPGKRIENRYRIRHKNGHYIWVEGKYTNLLDDPHINSIVYNYHDITKRVKAEERINYEKYISDSIINSLPGIFYLFNRDLQFIRWNRNFEVVSGYSSEEIMQMQPLDFFDEEDKAMLHQKIISVFDNGSDEVEAGFYTRSKHKLPYYFTGRLAIFDGKEFYIGVGIDISERKLAREKVISALKEQETTLNRISDAVISLDRQWRYLFLNDAALETHPGGREHALGKTILEIHPELKETVFWKTYQESMETMQVMEVESFYQPMGMWFSVKVYPSFDGITVFYRNINERKKIEKETIQSIGRELHDNILQIVTTSDIYLKSAVVKNDEALPFLDKAASLLSKAIEEIRMLSHDLIHSFHSGQKFKGALEEILDLARTGSGINIHSEIVGFIDERLPERFKVNLFRIVQEQINNIIKYAKAGNIHLILRMTDEHLDLVIKDDGIGFDTSLEYDGVGLANIETRVHHYNGSFQVSSSPNNGCEIRIVFPASEVVV